jgi:hypothetical protein
MSWHQQSADSHTSHTSYKYMHVCCIAWGFHSCVLQALVFSAWKQWHPLLLPTAAAVVAAAVAMLVRRRQPDIACACPATMPFTGKRMGVPAGHGCGRTVDCDCGTIDCGHDCGSTAGLYGDRTSPQQAPQSQQHLRCMGRSLLYVIWANIV